MGAIARYVQHALTGVQVPVVAAVVRPTGLKSAQALLPGSVRVTARISDLPQGVTHVIDCAGHSGLRAHGTDALQAGLDVITLSVGALADQSLADELGQAAKNGHSQLHLASGAVGALDALRSAQTGSLDQVRYVGRKPPRGWAGSRAQEVLDLASITDGPQTHFVGSARDAALLYPKNANVAAAVALAGIGFDRTEVELIADPTITTNIHAIRATGDFGTMFFEVSGASLPDAPRSSALAAMSVVSAILQQEAAVHF